MRQSALTLIARITDDGLDPLRLVLKNKEAALKDALGRLGTIHYARWVILEPSPGYTAQLAFGSNFDGPVEQHIGDLVRHLGPLVNDIYSHCVDYSSVDPASYLLNIRTPEAAFYQGSPGRTVTNIANEKKLRNRLVRRECWKLDGEICQGRPQRITNTGPRRTRIRVGEGTAQDARHEQPELGAARHRSRAPS